MMDRKSKIKPFFTPVFPKVSFPDLERKLLDYWYKSGVVKEYLRKNAKSKKIFSFLDGPITANNPMGVHHAWGRTYKDLWQRFYNMLGYKQRFQNGFDCQGLWVEVEVEKELGLKSKRDIENLVPGDRTASIAKFVELCKKRVFKYARIQTDQSKRLGYFMDWENSYFTLSDVNNYMIWHFLKECHKRGLIYKGSDVVPWCPRCQTAISEHEILTEDYREVTHESLYLKFPVVGGENEFLLIWTTTPWTVPANIAVAVNPQSDYQLVYDGKDKFWIGKKLVKSVFAKDVKVLKEVKGESLLGLKYETPFDNLSAVLKVKNEKGFHEVIATDPRIMPISEEEGTGLVHTSTGTGAEDHKLGEKLNLPIIPAIEDDASYLPDFGFLTGKNAKEEPHLIIDYLREYQNGKYLYKVDKYKHRYPVCWRCKKELVFKLTDEWYIAVNPLREAMKRVARKINWIPSFGLKRELDWLTNMHDWLISKKNRYWGLALPIWECKKCNNFEVIGGKEELKTRAVEGWESFKGHSPHKPFIDEIKIRCSRCGELSERIPDVGNPWLDAGIVPFSTISSDNKSEPLYLINRKEWLKWFPADFITESFPGQFKNWFYSLIAMSAVLENREPFKNVLGFATLLAEDGKPMHKSWGNMIEFNEGAEKIGVDVMRWMYVKQNPSENLLFGYKVADEVRRRFHIKLWNVYNFFVTYANLDGFRPKGLKPKKTSQNILDKWIRARLKETIFIVTEKLKEYDAFSASNKIEEFVEDLSNWYIRRSRERTGFDKVSKRDAENFYETCYFVLTTLCKILAPFNPFISEVIYRNLTKEKSVHLSNWPKTQKPTLKEYKLIEQMAIVRELVELGHSIRKKENIPVRQPLKAMCYWFNDSAKMYKPSEYNTLLKTELNVKEVFFTKDYKNLKIKGNWFSVKSDKSHTSRFLRVSLLLDISEELEEEAKSRDLIRKIQLARKNMNIKIDQNIIVHTPWLPTSKELIQKIKRKTLTQKLLIGNFKVEKI